MSFTANEMVTAISQNETINSYMEDRFERAGFAEHLSFAYAGCDETADELLYDLAHCTRLYEGTDVTELYAELMGYRDNVVA